MSLVTMERKKKALKNIGVSFLLEIVNILSGFIIPSLIIGVYGSPTNGLISSISNFIGYVALLQSGVGSVIKAALYRPLAERDSNTINNIVSTLVHFFKRISAITAGYVVLLVAFFTIRMSANFDFAYTASLVVIIGFSTVAQYLWGLPYQILLEADQKGYVYAFLQAIGIVINTIISIVLIYQGFSIQIVKLVTAIVFVMRPLLIKAYTIKKYRITTNGKIDNNLLRSRWDGVAQAVAFFIHSKTDIFVLTIFAIVNDVSVYSVYALILGALTTLIKAVDQSVGPAFGNIIAKKEKILGNRFDTYRIASHIASTILFGTACITAPSFVSIYTKNFLDYQYVRPLFCTIILTAEYVYCLRLPYNCIIYAAGKIKESRNPAIIEAIINIVLSVIFVNIWGMEGVAIATLIAMIYRTITLVLFLKKDILYLGMLQEIRHISAAIVSFAISIGVMVLTRKYSYQFDSYFEWVVFAGIITLTYTVIVLTMYLIFDKKSFKVLVKSALHRGKKVRVS